MSTRAGPIYEVTLFVDRDAVADCDLWLDAHAHEARLMAGVDDCHVFATADDDAGRAGRICQYWTADDEALDHFLDHDASTILAVVAQQFAGTVEIHSRVLRPDPTLDAPRDPAPRCLNCGTQLRGQYCGHCGQRSRSRLISLWELTTDAFGDLFELDSRLWQTVVPLLLRPGRLTRDYLQGRRARFMPPFRMYLVLSVLFFVVAFFDPREEFGLFFEPAAEVASIERGAIVTFGEPGANEVDDDCEIDAEDIEELPRFVARRLSAERLQKVCAQIVADQGRNLSRKVLDSTPAALIVLLPLMALVLQALYPLSRRYYVEHLLFFVHFHAFVFLLLTLEILFSRLAALLYVPEFVSTLLVVATSFYIPAYAFVAMRRVYGQGRFVTLLKFVVLAIAYITGFSLIIAATFLIAAFSI